MSVLVDTSIWIDYFRGGNDSAQMDFLIDENLLVTNDLILTELIPFLKVRNETKIIDLLQNINKLEISILDFACYKKYFIILKNGKIQRKCMKFKGNMPILTLNVS